MSSTSPSVRIVADIGGTNARFGHVYVSESELRVVHTSACAEFPLFVDAIRAYMARCEDAEIVDICLAVAGPVEQDWIDLPNNHWAFSRRELERELGVPVAVINDFSAQVYSIEALGGDDFHWLGSPRPEAASPGVIAVLGPGTGLGVSGMLPSGEIIPSEGGHIAFAPNNAHQLALLEQLWRRYERVSVERLLSGMGLANLYWANGMLQGVEKELTAPEITAGACAGDTLCLQAVEDFSAILGSVAGDLALAMGAYNGVYLSGGILPKMLDIIDESLVRDNFQQKGRFSDICKNIPLAIVLANYPGLVGCINAANRRHTSPATSKP